jgi:hypothetical protein
MEERFSNIRLLYLRDIEIVTMIPIWAKRLLLIIRFASVHFISKKEPSSNVVEKAFDSFIPIIGKG